MTRQGVTRGNLLGIDILGNLGGPALGHLEALLGLVLDSLPLDGGAESLRATVVVASDVGQAGVLGRVLGEVVVESSLQLGLLQVLIAVERTKLAEASR
jgi:hypothetical protein